MTPLSGTEIGLLEEFERQAIRASQDAQTRLAIARDFVLACGVRPMDIRFAKRLAEWRVEIRDGDGTPWRVAHRQWWHVDRSDGYVATLCMQWMP